MVLRPVPAGGDDVLGLGAHRKKGLPGIRPLARLPQRREYMRHLEAMIETYVPQVGGNLQLSAWSVILGRPQLAVELPTPASDRFLVEGFAPDPKHRLRHFLVGCVMFAGDGQAHGVGIEVDAAPVAACGELVLCTPADRRDISLNAWARVTWCETTDHFADKIADVLTNAPVSLRPAKKVRVVVASDHELLRPGSHERVRLELRGNVLGVGLEFLVPAQYTARAAQMSSRPRRP